MLTSKHMKPNAIVTVKRDGYSHYGEVMSFITPERTLMVRRVPGHPGTLEEVSVDKLDDPHNPVKHVHYAVLVPPRRSADLPINFPVDMLRYEWASPVNFELVEGEVFTDVRMLEGFEETRLLIAHASRDRKPHWTPERWNSFGWKMAHIHSEKL